MAPVGREGGYAMVVALSLITILAIVLATYSLITVNNTRTSRSSGNASAGFYAAEAALNARAEQIRVKFKGFETPNGTSPTTSQPCANGDVGSLDFICKTDNVAGRTVTSYVERDTPETINIPQGELFENLTAEETPFTVYGQAVGATGNPEAIANLVFRSRLVPLFQFAVFFDKDLEFSNTATLNLDGPVHTNGNLFLDSGTGGGTNLTINGQVTAAATVFRGQKHQNVCQGTVNIFDATNARKTMACSGGTRSAQTGAALNTYGGRVKDNLGRLEVPTVAQLQPQTGAQYWDLADVRVVLKRSLSVLGVEIWTARFVNDAGTVLPALCPLGTGLTPSQSFRDNREAQFWTSAAVNQPARANRRMLDVDVPAFLNCLQTAQTTLGLNGGLADTSQGGLVIYLTVDDSTSTGILSQTLGGLPGAGVTGSSQSNPPRPNNYGIRLQNGDSLRSNNPAHPAPKGITFVTDQAAFIEGNFNSVAANWIPTAVLSDTINVLSEGWTTLARCQVSWNGQTYFMNTAAGLAGAVATPAGAPASSGGTPWFYYTNPASGYIPFTADEKSRLPLWCRNAAPTTVQAAILSATSTSGTTLNTTTGLIVQDGEDTLGQNPQSGGVHNMMRFHEEWGSNGYNPAGATQYTYRGSLVSLNQPLHAVGAFQLASFNTTGYIFYNPPLRNWSFETRFRDASQLPPLSPRFVYLKQDNFSRSFQQ